MIPLDPDRTLALAYVPAGRRAAVEALWRLDAALAAVLSGGREPMISQIRLAWWREALERLDHARPPAEPVLEGLAAHVLPCGVSGAELAGMEEAWTVLLSPDPLGEAELASYARRGALLFALSARLLGGSADERVEAAGESWALIDLARHSANPDEAEAAARAAGRRSHPASWPRALRPLGMLGVLALRDAEGPVRWEEQGSPARMLRMLRHRLTGR